jgi:site-specific DNA-cytosine methylase
MKYISICSGIEAATVAFHGFGWTPLAFSEIEAFPSTVLAARWPQVPNLGDMTKFAEWPEEILAECDLLVGGPPCQAFSVAGLRKSLDDDRGNITLAYVRLLNHIDEVRKRHGRPPAIAVYENVPGLLSTKDNAFGCLIGALAGCDEAPETETGKWPKAGYVCGEARRVGYRILDAQFFGVAQRRRRIFLVAVPCELVASLGDNACPSEILSLRESVRGNPPSRSKAGQGAAAGTEGRPRVGGEPCYLDRAMFNQGVNAQYKPQITQDGVAGSMVARGPAAVGVQETCGTLSDGAHRGGGLTDRTHTAVAFLPSVANPLTHRMHKGMNTTVDEGQTPIVTTGGVFGEATCFKPSHFTRGKDGKPSDVTPPLSADADKGDQDTVVCATGQRTHALTTRAACEEDGTGRGNPIVPAQAVGFNWQNGGGYGKANDVLGITEEGTGPLQRCNTPAVAFTAKDYGGDATSELSPTMRAMQHVDGNANAGGQLAVAYGLRGDAGREGVAKTPSADAEGRVRLRNPSFNPLEELSPTMDASQPHAVAFTQNQREEVRVLDIASACSAEPGSHQQTYIAQPAVAYVKATNPHGKEEAPRYEEAAVSACLNGWDERHNPPKHMVAFAQNQLGEVRCNSGSTAVPAVAFANRTRDGIKVPEVMKDGVVPALTNPGGGGRADAVNVCLPAPQGDQSIAFNAYQRTEGSATWPIGASDGRKVEVGVRSGMQVRRLTPSECEYLQGFPAGHTDIVFRKKPAADGPRYRALGNSMAVPCMVWLGYRIHKATKGDTE